MSIQAFDPCELTVTAEIPVPSGGGPIPIYSFPVTPREAYAAMYERSPIWQITGVERTLFAPKVNPDNYARASVFDGSGVAPGSGGGSDMFGIEWEYIEQAGGSMVRPGKPFLGDANEWPEKIVWPDIDAWDWEGCAKANEAFLDTDNYNIAWFLNGWYERLISFMDFEGAVVAMIDEDQTDAVKSLFDKLTDLYIKILGKYLTYFPRIDAFCIHDDWGSQRETFFSPATAEEMIVPYMRRVTDFLHSNGKYCELHSCGQIFRQIPNIIAAGWDSWSGQLMNDMEKIYELYGDKLIIPVPPPKGLWDMTEDDQRTAARDFADKFCNPEKPCIVNMYARGDITPAFRAELYKQSRIKFAK